MNKLCDYTHNHTGGRSEIAYPTIEPDVDDESDGDDWSPEDHG